MKTEELSIRKEALTFLNNMQHNIQLEKVGDVSQQYLITSPVKEGLLVCVLYVYHRLVLVFIASNIQADLEMLFWVLINQDYDSWKQLKKR